jgi:hypothetical protein
MTYGNGNGAAHDERPNGMRAIRITFDPHTFEMHINCDNMPLDCAHAMLTQATRWVDGQLRAAQVIALQQRMADAARTQAIVDSVGRGGLHKV